MDDVVNYCAAVDWGATKFRASLIDLRTGDACDSITDHGLGTRARVLDFEAALEGKLNEVGWPVGVAVFVCGAEGWRTTSATAARSEGMAPRERRGPRSWCGPWKHGNGKHEGRGASGGWLLVGKGGSGKVYPVYPNSKLNLGFNKFRNFRILNSLFVFHRLRN